MDSEENKYKKKYKEYRDLYLIEKEKNSHTFLNNLKWRRAEKHFSPGYVDTSLIEKAMANAPTSYGMQPFHIFRITDPKLKEILKPACHNQAQITECYALFIFCARTDLENRANEFLNAKKPNNIPNFRKYIFKYLNKRCAVEDKPKETECNMSVEWAKRQAYIALGYGLAAASELKIASCPIEGFEPEKVAKVLNLDDTLNVCVLLTVGKIAKYKREPRFRFHQSELIERIKYDDVK